MVKDDTTAADALGLHDHQCRDALGTLYGYLDGELTEQRRSQIQHHLEECSPCLGAFDFEAELKVVIARRCRDQVPEHLRIRVAAVLAQASQDGELPHPSGASGMGEGTEH